MSEAELYREKQRQCLRLIRATTDQTAIEGMTALAAEFEAKAQAAEGGSAAGITDGTSAAASAFEPVEATGSPVLQATGGDATLIATTSEAPTQS
jgi:hypothetical protein